MNISESIRVVCLTNPCISSGNSLGDDFWGGSDLVFINYLESTGAVCADESIHKLCKQFRWWFMSRQRLRFHWQFQSQQGLCVLTNPCVSFRTSFGDDYWVPSDSVFLEYFWVNGGCVRWRIHLSPMEAVSVNISEVAATQLSLTISETIGAVFDNEWMPQLWKQFPWRFLRQ